MHHVLLLDGCDYLLYINICIKLFISHVIHNFMMVGIRLVNARQKQGNLRPTCALFLLPESASLVLPTF